MKTLTSSLHAAGTPVSDHVVVLIPGFLGFNKIGDHGYFAEKVGQKLADALSNSDPGRAIPVEVVETIPAGTLEQRQAKLIEELKRLRVKYPDAVFHLVGHSTGGLDAELLARTPRPSDAPRDAETEAIRRSIRSIVTLASPLAGTSLAQSPLAQFAAIDSLPDLLRAPASLLLFRGPSAVLGLLGGAIGLVSDAAATDIARNVLHRFAGASYFTSLVFMRGLIDDLVPEKVVDVMTEQTQEDPALPDIHRARFVTIAPGTTEQRTLKQWLGGELFDFFYANTRDNAKSDAGTDLVERALKARLGSIPVIGADGVPLPPLDIAASDAIVNSLRQLAPGDAATVARELNRLRALVIADHIDVVGYFPGKDGGDNGFLTSGAKFRETEFEKLYTAIAQEIDVSIRKPTRPPVPPPAAVTSSS